MKKAEWLGRMEKVAIGSGLLFLILYSALFLTVSLASGLTDEAIAGLTLAANIFIALATAVPGLMRKGVIWLLKDIGAQAKEITAHALNKGKTVAENREEKDPELATIEDRNEGITDILSAQRDKLAEELKRLKKDHEKQVQALEQQKQDEIKALREKHKEELADKNKEIDRTKQMLAQLKFSIANVVTKLETVNEKFENHVRVEASPGTASAVRRTSRSASCESFFFKRALSTPSQEVLSTEPLQRASATAPNLEEESDKLSKSKR